MNRFRTTPAFITALNPNERFVVGTNKLGVHGAGGALTGRKLWGLRPGVGEGPSGQCYALPTKRGPYEDASLIEVADAVAGFIEYARSEPKLIFLVTEVGCKLAGFMPAEIAPLFADAVPLSNVFLPARFWAILCKNEVIHPIPVEPRAGISPPVLRRPSDGVGVVMAQDRGPVEREAQFRADSAQQLPEG